MEWIIFPVSMILLCALVGALGPFMDKWEEWSFKNPTKSDRVCMILCIPFIPIFILALPMLWVMMQSDSFVRKITHK